MSTTPGTVVAAPAARSAGPPARAALLRALAPLVAVAISLAIGAIFIAAIGEDPIAIYALMLRESLGHTRMLKWTTIGAAHWFVMVAFGALVFTLVEAYGEVIDPRFEGKSTEQRDRPITT